ncbi:hypothetical protein SH661x_003759 [Planctomicrobium sp. SH661]|uniref:hypothetical protein n=1 Tax=Planctomicrobium sp. SH661 TaxID=3448124 RepID=UPI003F5BAE27
MASFLAHLLTILAFAAHVFGGCCSHHLHAQADQGSQVVPHSRSCCSQKSAHAQAPDTRPAEHSDSEHPHENCFEAACQYILNSPVQFDPMSVACPLPVMELEISSPLHLGPAARTDLDSGPRLLTHASRCALLQTWLV